MNILITGVHGFVGSNLVKYLAKENTIYGLDIVQPQKDGVMCTFSWDALDVENGLPEIDAIIHLAGMAHDTRNKSAADVYFKVNTGLTQKIFDWYMASPTAKKFVFFSTVKSAADRVKGEFLTEECVPTPVGPYGESKIKAEDYIIKKFAPKALKRLFHNFDDSDSIVSDKQVYIIRPCMIHGPGNKGNLNMLYGVVKKGIPWPLGAFENRRSFTSIGNLCVVIEGLLTKSVPSGIYHMGDDEALSTNELIEVICEAIGKKAHIWRIPKGLMNGVAKVGGWLHLPLNPLRMQKLTENYVVSNKKIKSALGIDAMPIRAKDGLIDTIRSFGK
ncbi:NAD-dependent epimerase/dehydratase family protein [Parabacteroides merdae]|uniref:NAD-dependent epimerase/dehydratase family protein n=1 Tax=Parabacteroides merdae TaxID=46503 RepID=UPI000EEA8149|nr:NAD-dependent epimerase/dehydratase family protein [Parabacteroides merdae]RGM98420.1 NAD-dependent epimerase/dehydratase family protein [Parabacteroides merdae]